MKYKVSSLKKLDISDKQVLWDDDVEVVIADGHFEDVFIEGIRKHQVNAITCRTEVVTPAMMDASPDLKVIAKHGVGLDDIGVECIAKKGVQMVYTPLGNYSSIAKHVVVLMLMAACRYKHVDREFRSGNFDVRYTLQDTFELEGLTLGILGCGRISQIIASKAVLGFGMNVIDYDPYARQESMKAPVKLLENGDDVLTRADSISLNLSPLPFTRDGIDYAAFQKMKPKTSFISHSRGDVVMEAGLIKVLQEGLILSTGLNVFDEEPIEYTNPMLEMDNAIMTPYIAATTRQTVVRCCITATRGIIEIMNGKPTTFPGDKIDRLYSLSYSL